MIFSKTLNFRNRKSAKNRKTFPPPEIRSTDWLDEVSADTAREIDDWYFDVGQACSLTPEGLNDVARIIRKAFEKIGNQIGGIDATPTPVGRAGSLPGKAQAGSPTSSNRMRGELPLAATTNMETDLSQPEMCTACWQWRHQCRCPKTITSASNGAQQRPEVSSGEWVGALERLAYTYEDLLEAYKTGRYHEIQYGRGDGDQEDFITWLKRRCAPTDQAQ